MPRWASTYWTEVELKQLLGEPAEEIELPHGPTFRAERKPPRSMLWHCLSGEESNRLENDRCWAIGQPDAEEAGQKGWFMLTVCHQHRGLLGAGLLNEV